MATKIGEANRAVALRACERYHGPRPHHRVQDTKRFSCVAQYLQSDTRRHAGRKRVDGLATQPRRRQFPLDSNHHPAQMLRGVKWWEFHYCTGLKNHVAVTHSYHCL